MNACALVVLEPGLLATIQDLGRRGLGEMGVSPAGAADWLAARAANRLVGNPDGSALIETTLSRAVFAAQKPMLVAVTGARTRVVSGGVERRGWTSWRCAAGDRIEVSAPRFGARSYVAIEGGLDVERLMDSASTDVTAGFGGRVLVAGDRLDALAIDDGVVRQPRQYRAGIDRYCEPPFVLRAMAGPQERLLESVSAPLLDTEYRAGSRSSRQALRLDGAKCAVETAREVLTTGVCAGCVQIAGDGLPTVLLAEHQTTGGYPVGLCVIVADLPVAAQTRPGDAVRFQRVTLRDAVDARESRMRDLRSSTPAAGQASVDAGRLGAGFFEGASP